MISNNVKIWKMNYYSNMIKYIYNLVVIKLHNTKGDTR